MGVSESIQMSAMQHQESGYLLELIYQTAEGYIVYDRFFAVWLKNQTAEGYIVYDRFFAVWLKRL